MNEIRISSFDFYLSGNCYKDRLFCKDGEGTGEILILARDDGTETEAIVPIEEYRRLRASAGPADDAPKAHKPCPWCGADDPERFSVMGWPRPQSPDWLVVVCSMCQAQGPTVPRVKDESRDEWVNWAWELWDARYDEAPSTVDDEKDDR